jgi:Kef-type K+ transport system membrane component KefB
VVRHGKDYKEGAEYLHIIFASIFFVSLGILVDVHVLTPAVLLFLCVLTVVAVLTKVLGCSLPARWLGMSVRDSAVVGFGMSPRGEVAMIVGLIGLNQGLITQEIYAAIIFMSLLTTVVTPIVLRNWLYKDVGRVS